MMELIYKDILSKSSNPDSGTEYFVALGKDHAYEKTFWKYNVHPCPL